VGYKNVWEDEYAQHMAGCLITNKSKKTPIPREKKKHENGIDSFASLPYNVNVL
jgi:hypothetical protein